MSYDPVLVKKFGSYNIIEWMGNFFGVPVCVGPIQVDKGDFSSFPGFFKSASLEEAEKQIAANFPMIQKHTKPVLEETFGPYSILSWGALY